MAGDVAWHFGIDLRHLRYFRQVADTGSFSEAARVLHCAQPPLSRQIRQLEQRLGSTLFERRPAGIRLTPTGELFRREIEGVLRRFDAAVVAVTSFRPTEPRSIHVGYAPSPTESFRQRIVTTLEQMFVGIRIVLHDLSVEECVQKIAQREIHFALNVEPLRHRVRNLVFQPVVTLEMRCAVSTLHPLSRKRFLSLKQIEGERLLVFSPKLMPQYLMQLRRAFKPHGIVLHPAEEYDGIATLLPAVARGHGAALLLESAAALADDKVSWLRLKPSLPPVRVGILYSKSVDPLVKSIVAAAADAV